MKVGNVSQTVLKRSVLKQLHTKRKEILTDLSVEEMCTAVQIRDTEDVVFASAVVSGNSKNIGVYAIMRAVLDLETRGASAIGVSVQVILPTYAYESRLKEMFRCMEERCASWGIAITCAKAETSPAVSQSVVSVTAAGSVEKGQLRTLAQAEPNQEIVLCGSIAAEGVLRIFDEKREELSKRFVPAFMRQIQGIESELEVFHALRSVKQENTPKGEPLVTAMQQIGSGGILASLWELTEAANVGMQIEMSRISIRQECVEVCEYYHLNPYQMTSAGTVLMVTRDGNALVRCLEESGARASVLGVTTADHAKVITSGDEVRYLDRPAPDELMRWWEEQAQKEVKIVSTGKCVRKLIKGQYTLLSDAEIEARMQELSYLKIHPRDQEENKLWLLKGERLYEESLGEMRIRIAMALQKFEEALDTHDNRKIEIARESFKAFLEPFL